MSEIFVKVGKVPGATTEVVLNQGATVADALSAAGIEMTSTTLIKLNGGEVSTSDTLSDNSRLIVSDGAKVTARPYLFWGMAHQQWWASTARSESAIATALPRPLLTETTQWQHQSHLCWVGRKTSRIRKSNGSLI